MKIVDGRVLANYIFGNDVSPYTLEELESNPRFMLEVMRKTGDVKTYELCADNVRRDFEFINYMVMNFPQHKEYVLEAVEYYFECSTDEYTLDNLEILVKVAENYKSEVHALMMQCCFCEEQVNIASIKLQSGSEEELEALGLGFYLIKEGYENRKVLLDYFAKHMVYEVFLEDETRSLEQLVHQCFKSREDLEAYGVVRFLVDFIGTLDRWLADHLAINPYLLDGIVEMVKGYLNRWDFYMKNLNDMRVSLVMDEVYGFLQEYRFYPFEFVNMLISLLKSKGVWDCFKEELEGMENEEDVEISNEVLAFNFRRRIGALVDDLWRSDVIILKGEDEEVEKDCMIMEFKREEF